MEFHWWLGGKKKKLRFNPWVRKIPWRRNWQPAPIFLPGKFHGQRNPENDSHGIAKESDIS